jgi:signal transduction histidine kinase/ligand-binding sensor domain-containing protein/AraC-like DNA-binding protein
MISKYIRKYLGIKLVLMALMLFAPDVYSQSQRTTFVPIGDKVLSGSFGRCFFKDSKGYMWIGTADGLMRYDGFKVYQYEHNTEDKKSIVNNGINVIAEDSKQRLWIGTAQGLCIYDREKDNFINVDSIPSNKNHLNNVYITTLEFDKQGNTWIGTYGGGINIYNPKTATFFYASGINVHSSPLAKNYITDFLLVDDLMWTASKGGVKVFNVKSKSEVSVKLTNGSLPRKQVTQLVEDSHGSIWFSTFDGEINKLKYSKGYYSLGNKISNTTANLGTGLYDILTMVNDGKDNFWIGGANSGLNYFDAKKNRIISFNDDKRNAKGLPTSSVRSVYKDNTGLVWIGTYNKGVYLIDNNAGRFDSYQLGDFQQSNLEGKDVTAFVEDKNGNVWIAYNGIGLVLLDKKTNSLKRLDLINQKISSNILTTLTFDNENNLWVGTGGNGVYKINITSNNVINYPIESGGFGDKKAFYLYKDSKGVVWCGSNGSGLFYFDDKKQQFISFYEKDKPLHISNRVYVSSIIEDSENALWVGSMYGLYKLIRNKNGSFDYKLYRQDIAGSSFPSNSIQCIYEDIHQNLWFGTTDNGIVFKSKQGNKFKTFQKKDGLPSNTVRSILMDSIGNMWFGGNMGLSKLNTQTNLITNYDESDGLTSNNLYSNPITTTNGRLFFGSNNGFNTFYPDSIQTQSIKPIVYLTDLRINNKSVGIDALNSPLEKHISLASSIKLKYDERSFALDFVGLSYGRSPNYTYCYMLEGFDTDWNCMGSRLSATYTNIDPGDYVFLVKASNRDGVWSDVQRLKITIKQIWWKTWWAIVLYITFLTTLTLFLFRIRMERLRMKNQLVMERLAREREHELSESKTQFFTNISHEFRTPLSLISMPLESLSAMEELPLSVKERIGAIRLSSNKMLRLVNELMDFNKLENAKLKLQVQHGELVRFITNIADTFNDVSQKRNIHFATHSMVGTLYGWFDHDKLEKILVNILSNAFKFTSDKGKINIIINSKEAIVGEQQNKVSCLELTIVDNGIGISENELPYIFDKFYQAKSSPKVANSGTGIGLSLTKGLVELHQGQIKVESKPNQETLFVILIPIDKEIYSDESIGEIPECVDTAAELINYAETFDYDSDEDDNNDKPQILIVEDNDELRKYLALELKHHFHVIEASDGEEGLKLALEISPDLIISDILMPIKNGIELCNDIKTNLKTSHIPFILLTARTTVDDQIIGIETGADVYITKPFSIRFLVVQVNQIIESRQKLYSQFSKDVYLLPNKVAQNEIDQEFLQKAIDYIVENIQNPQLGVNSIADLFNLSRMQVYRKIKALTGKSVVNFIRMVRIKQALKLMDTQKYSLTEIAFLTGFNSASYFTTSFKEEYGKAPSEYMEQ